MAAKSQTPYVVILDNDDEDDVRILKSNPILGEKGSSSRNPISIDSNSEATRKRKRAIHINIDDDDDHKSTCEICTDEKPRIEFFRTKGCAHSYCSECTSKHVSSKLQQNSTKIGCPSPGCSGRLEIQDCRRILPGDVFDRWGSALCEATIPDSEKFYCPNRDCSALFINDGGDRDQLRVVCPNCRRMLCAMCRVPWHSGITCQELMTKDDDALLINLAEKKKWTRCPNCKVFVEKDGGCEEVDCRCGSSFCYTCGHELCRCYESYDQPFRNASHPPFRNAGRQPYVRLAGVPRRGGIIRYGGFH